MEIKAKNTIRGLQCSLDISDEELNNRDVYFEFCALLTKIIDRMASKTEKDDLKKRKELAEKLLEILRILVDEYYHAISVW